jgi:DNA topoisomerase-1
MANARVAKTNISITPKGTDYKFLAKGEIVIFDGFLKVYGNAKDTTLPDMNEGDIVTMHEITAKQNFAKPPARYTEGTLVKKLEELGIGRPSTYAPTITTLTTERGYLVKGDKPGELRPVVNFTLKSGAIQETDWNETVGADKGKLLPTEIGMVVTDYLVENFEDVLDYGFTAEVEQSFDQVAAGKKDWHRCISDFYSPFHKEVSQAVSTIVRCWLER